MGKIVVTYVETTPSDFFVKTKGESKDKKGDN